MPPAEYSKGFGLDGLFSEKVTLSSLFECLLFDLFSLLEDLFSSTKVSIGRRDIVRGLVITLMIVVVYKPREGGREFFGAEVVLQLHHVLHTSVIAHNLPLRLWVLSTPMNVLDAHTLQVGFPLLGNVAGAVIREQPGTLLRT